jgi:hypothetical protein
MICANVEVMFVKANMKISFCDAKSFLKKCEEDENNETFIKGTLIYFRLGSRFNVVSFDDKKGFSIRKWMTYANKITTTILIYRK